MTVISLVVATASLLAISTAQAQQTTGAPGSPDASTTIDGRYLPNPPQPFGGEINLNSTSGTMVSASPPWPSTA